MTNEIANKITNKIASEIADKIIYKILQPMNINCVQLQKYPPASAGRYIYDTVSAPCRGIHICAEAGEYFAVYIARILTESCCYLFRYLSMLIYFHSLYHKCISLKRQTLKKIKKTTNNIKIINQKHTKNKYKARFNLKLFTFWSKSASL